jgi:hypothetical protein
MGLVVGCVTLAAAGAALGQGKRPGLVVKGQKLHHKGEAFRGIGVNYYHLFTHVFNKPEANQIDRRLRRLAQHDVPFVRFAACTFRKRSFALFQQDREVFWRRMDQVIDAAERHNLGLIPSFFWRTVAVPNLFNESIQAWGDPSSQTRQFMARYTRAMVKRYHNSPAIWAWEFGNEYNLHVDLPHGPKTGRTRFTTKMLRPALQHFGRVVRSIDEHRPITSGHALPRDSAWHNHQGDYWTTDNAAQFRKILRLYHPDPLDLLSIHIYADDVKWDGQAHDTIVEQVRRQFQRESARSADAARRIDKPLFLGEFGVPSDAGPKLGRRLMRLYFKMVRRHEIPLAAVWGYAFKPNPKSEMWNFNARNTNGRAYILDMLETANARLNQPPDDKR